MLKIIINTYNYIFLSNTEMLVHLLMNTSENNVQQNNSCVMMISFQLNTIGI